MISLLFLGCSSGAEDSSRKSVSLDSKSRREAKVVVEVHRPKEPESFTLEDVDGRRSRVDFYRDRVVFKKIKQPIVVVNILSDRCPPCRGMLPYLNDLQRKNRKRVFVLGILVKSTLDKKALKSFMKKYHLSFFISNHRSSRAISDKLAMDLNLGSEYKIPLTVIFYKGRYFIHTVGATPFEMLQELIDQLN